MFHQKGAPQSLDEKILALQATDSVPDLVRSSGATVTFSALVSSREAVRVAPPTSQSSEVRYFSQSLRIKT